MTFVRDHLPDPLTYYEGQGLTFQERKGKWRTTGCAFHGGNRMRINTQTGAFVCMSGCGAKGGDLLAYQMAAQGQDFVTAAKALGAWQDDPSDTRAQHRRPLPFPARDALEVLTEEANLVAVAAGNVAHGVPMSAADKERLMQAAGRIRVIAREVAA